MDALDEVNEHAHHAGTSFDRRVAVTMAAIAAALAIVSVLGHIESTEELLSQQRASDQWAYYQAKSIRRYQSDVAQDMLASLDKTAIAEKYARNSERYEKESEEIQVRARELQTESDHAGRKPLRLHFGEIFLEIAIVFASLAILTKRTLARPSAAQPSVWPWPPPSSWSINYARYGSVNALSPRRRNTPFAVGSGTGCDAVAPIFSTHRGWSFLQ